MVTSSWRGLVALLGLMLLGCSGSAPSSQRGKTAEALPGKAQPGAMPWRVSEIKEPRLFTSGRGLRVELVPVDSTFDRALDDHFLLRATGAQNDQDGVVLLVQELETGGFRTSIRGEPSYPIYRQGSEYHSSDEGIGWFYQHNASRKGTVPLALGDANEIDANELLERYQRQEASGLNDRFAPKTRAAREHFQNEQLRKYLAAEYYQTCGPLAMSIDWSTVEDDWFEEFSIAGTCINDLPYLINFCSCFPSRVAEVQAASPIRCEFSGKPGAGEYVPPSLGEAGKLSFVARDRPRSGYATEIGFRTIFGEEKQVLRSKNLYFIVRDEPGEQRAVYSGDGKTFYPYGAMPETTDGASLILPSRGKGAEFYHYLGSWFLACDLEKEKLEILEGKEKEAILKAAVFQTEPKWKRMPYFLARDSRGTYFYVDQLKKELGGKRYRVFTGRRGQLKLSKLKGVVDDSVGTVFSTDDGELRLVVAVNNLDAQATWIRGNKKSLLTPVDIMMNNSLIYDELGAYFGEDLGFVCPK